MGKLQRVGYIVKRYPCYSETFIVNEILAHEAAGLDIEIFSLRPTLDSHFQDIISQVQAPVHFLRGYKRLQGIKLWEAIEQVSEVIPEIWSRLVYSEGEDVHNIFQALQIAYKAHSTGITHLHAHFATSPTSVARLASHFAEIPYSFTTHAKDIFHQDVEYNDLERKLRDATTTIAISDYNRNYLCQTYSATAGKVRRIYNGLDLQKFPFRSPEKCPPQIISVGRLVEKKGFSTLIEACALLAKRGCRFTCQIAGKGVLEAELRSLIEQLHLTDVVKLIGPQPQNKIIELVQEAAVFVGPYIIGSDGNRDGLPTVLLEAMALGTPCISTNVTGIPEVIKDRETGLLVPQLDPIALAAEIETLLNNPYLRVRLAMKARKLIVEKFDIHRNTTDVRQVFYTASTKNIVSSVMEIDHSSLTTPQTVNP